MSYLVTYIHTAYNGIYSGYNYFHCNTLITFAMYSDLLTKHSADKNVDY